MKIIVCGKIDAAGYRPKRPAWLYRGNAQQQFARVGVRLAFFRFRETAKKGNSSFLFSVCEGSSVSLRDQAGAFSPVGPERSRGEADQLCNFMASAETDAVQTLITACGSPNSTSRRRFHPNGASGPPPVGPRKTRRFPPPDVPGEFSSAQNNRSSSPTAGHRFLPAPHNLPPEPCLEKLSRIFHCLALGQDSSCTVVSSWFHPPRPSFQTHSTNFPRVWAFLVESQLPNRKSTFPFHSEAGVASLPQTLWTRAG